MKHFKKAYKKNVTEKRFPSLGFRKTFPFPRKTSDFPQNLRFIPSEGKPFSATFPFLGDYGSCCIKLFDNPANGCSAHFKRFVQHFSWLSSECLHKQSH